MQEVRERTEERNQKALHQKQLKAVARDLKELKETQKKKPPTRNEDRHAEYPCPVEGCVYKGKGKSKLRRHYVAKHREMVSKAM